MLDRIRRLLERKRRRQIATPRRFLLESLEDRLNFSFSATASMDFSVTVAIQDRINATPLEASRERASITDGSTPGAASGLMARRDDTQVLRAARAEPVAFRPPTLPATRSPLVVAVVYSEPVWIQVSAPIVVEFVPIVVHVSSSLRPTVGFHTTRPSTNVVDRPLALNLSQYDAPAVNWDDNAAEPQQAAASSSLQVSRHDLALASLQTDLTPYPAAPAATMGSVSRPSELSVDRELTTLYGDEGGLIQIGRGNQRDRSLTDNAIKAELKKADQAAAEITRNELKTNLTKPSEDATTSRDENSRFAPRTDSLLERALAENSEGGLIDLMQVSTAGEILADAPEMVATADTQRAPMETAEPIEVDRSIGLFRAFELAVAPEGAVDEAVGDAAAATSDDDTTTETPVSADAAEFDPLVVPSGAAAIPAVLMVANWSHSNRRKRRRNQADAS